MRGDGPAEGVDHFDLDGVGHSVLVAMDVPFAANRLAYVAVPLADRYLLAGTPAQVVNRLAEYRDAGAQSMIFAGPRDAAEWRRSVELFAGGASGTARLA